MKTLSFIFVAVLAITSASAFKRPLGTKQKMAVLAQVTQNHASINSFLA